MLERSTILVVARQIKAFLKFFQSVVDFVGYRDFSDFLSNIYFPENRYQNQFRIHFYDKLSHPIKLKKIKTSFVKMIYKLNNIDFYRNITSNK